MPRAMRALAHSQVVGVQNSAADDDVRRVIAANSGKPFSAVKAVRAEAEVKAARVPLVNKASAVAAAS